MENIKSEKAKQHIKEHTLDKRFNDGLDHNCVRAETAVLAIHYAETEAEQRHSEQLEALKQKAVEVYKQNCRIYTPCCLEGKPCAADCEYLSDFIKKLNEK